MRLFSFYIVFSLVFSISLKAQYNYVPNYSFEQYDTCPISLSEIDKNCKKWFTPLSLTDTINYVGSSDFFNTCGNYNVSIPNNLLGWQYAKTGESYAGIALSASVPTIGNVNYKEYIEIKLNKKLLFNRKYCIEFHYSISDYRPLYSNYFPVSIEMLITDTIIKRNKYSYPPELIYAYPQIQQKLPIIIDTTSWITVSGNFVAKGGEQYLTIGNFQNTDTLTNKSVYVYIDDVKLYYCGPDTTHNPADSMIVPNVFTPNGDGYNDKFEYENQEQWKFETQIYSRWGNLVFENNNSENWDGKIDGNLVTSGVYFYVIKAVGIRNGEIRIYRGTVTVMY